MPAKSISNYRWTIVVLLFFATTINYIDRQVIGLLKPFLEKNFFPTESDYSSIVMAFQASYAIGLLFFGKLVDKIGSKKGYSISVIIWSVAAMLHAFVKSTFGFGAARVILGFGESGNFPSSIKAVAEWFPKKERALATGIFNAGTNIGAVIAPIIVPLILSLWGWQDAFLVTGALGFVWLIFWLLIYQIPAKKKDLSKTEFDFIHSDVDDVNENEISKTSWLKLFSVKQTWAFISGKFLTDPIWWFMLFWLPSYFSSTFKLDLTHPGWPLVIIYSCASVGSVGGGYLSSFLIRKGATPYAARKKTMLLFALLVLPLLAAKFITNMWMAVALLSIATAAHQAWSANMYTTASDYFPKKMLSSVIGIGGMAGAVGGIIFPKIVGSILDHFNALGNKTAGYNIIFVICAFAYLIAWLLMHFFSKSSVKN